MIYRLILQFLNARERRKKKRTFCDSIYFSSKGIKEKKNFSFSRFFLSSQFFFLSLSTTHLFAKFLFYSTDIRQFLIDSVSFFSFSHTTNVTMTTPTVTTIEQLSIANPSYLSDPNDPTGDIVDDDILPPMPFDRQSRPQSSRTTRSTTSRSSVNNLDGRVSCHDYHASKYFSYRVCLI